MVVCQALNEREKGWMKSFWVFHFMPCRQYSHPIYDPLDPVRALELTSFSSKQPLTKWRNYMTALYQPPTNVHQLLCDFGLGFWCGHQWAEWWSRRSEISYRQMLCTLKRLMAKAGASKVTYFMSKFSFPSHAVGLRNPRIGLSSGEVHWFPRVATTSTTNWVA